MTFIINMTKKRHTRRTSADDQQTVWTYRAKVVRVIDGDTVDVDINLGFGIWQKNERVRIMGIDTPESKTRNKISFQRGQKKNGTGYPKKTCQPHV